jgi:hypothetical protein
VEKWSEIVDLSRSRRTLMLSYSTGIQHYFPSVETPDLWTLQPGEIFEADKQRLMAKMRGADVVTQDLTGPNEFVRTDADVLTQLSHLCLIDKNKWFIVWAKPNVLPTRPCKAPG